MKTILTIFNSDGDACSTLNVERVQGRITTGLLSSLKEALREPDWESFLIEDDSAKGKIYAIEACLTYKGKYYSKQVSLTHEAVLKAMYDEILQESLMKNISELFYDMLISDMLEDTQEAN